jgi:hypothetical protein
MRTILKAGLAMVALVTVTTPVDAQGIAGTYLVEYPAQIQVTNGEENVQMGKARLTLEVKGDSVVGTWLVLNRPDAQPRAVRGTVQGNTAKFSIESEGRTNQNGEERTIKVTTDFSATVTGGKIDGTMEFRAEGMSRPARKFSGVREKADELP